MKQQRIHFSNMTFGEAWVKELNSIMLIDGKFKQAILITQKAKPMDTKLDGQGGTEAGRYYTNKLKKVWTKMFAEIPEQHREKIIFLAVNNKLSYRRACHRVSA